MNSEPEARIVKLLAMQEFRFEVEINNFMTLKIIEGTAELFGAELAQGTEYKFTGRKAAVFTWEGCEIETKGEAIEYIGHEVSMDKHINIHFALEDLRKQARQNDSIGPRVMIVGPADSGKSTLAKTLGSYSARSRSNVMLCDIDTEEGMISLPGTLAAFPLTRPIDPSEEFGGSSNTYEMSPICYYYGSSDIQEKRTLYSTTISNLAASVETRLQDKLDTPSQLVVHNKLEILDEVSGINTVGVILVIGDEKLLNILTKKYPESTKMKIMKIQKSGGVVTRDKDSKRQFQLQRVKQYFYGVTRSNLTPFSQTVSFTDVIVRRAVEGSIAPSSALPIGMEASSKDLKFVKVETGDILLHSVLAVSFAPLPGSSDAVGEDGKPIIYTPEEETELLKKTNISGFIFVSEVDDKKRKMTVLCPNPSRLPKTFMIMGSLKWMDS